MENERKIVFGVLILAIFTFIVAVSSLYVQIQISEGNICGCAIPLSLFIPFIGAIGLFIGTLLYYLLSPKFERKINIEFLSSLLEKEEYKIIEFLIKEKGFSTQSKIVKNLGMQKVRVSRILERLKEKGLIEKEKEGKINKIYLNEEIKKIVL